MFLCISSSVVALDSAARLLVVAGLVVSVELSSFSEADLESVDFIGASTALLVFLSDVTSHVVSVAVLLSDASAVSLTLALDRVFVSTTFVVV